MIEHRKKETIYIIVYYMSALGYVYAVEIRKGDLNKAIVLSQEQAVFPQNGYVTEYEDLIVVKLRND